MAEETAEYWRGRWSRQVAATVALEAENVQLRSDLAAVREAADEMVRDAYSRGMQ
jgi:hypothetical protein